MVESASPNLSETGVPTRGIRRDLEAARPALEDWFAQALPACEGFRLTQLYIPSTSGVANETLMCEASWRDHGRDRTGGYVVRVNSPDFLYKDVDLAVHAQMYQALRDEPGIPVPEIVGYEPDPSVLGQAFFVMNRIEGQVPEDSPPFHTAGWVHDLDPARREVLWHRAVEVLVRLHQVDAAKLPFLRRPGLGANGLEQDVGYWQGFSRWAARGPEHPVIGAAGDWLGRNLPDSPDRFSWGDSRLPNMMFRGPEVVAVFDWDMVGLAGPESDLAWWTVMDYTNTEAGGVQRLPGIGSPAETIRLWQELIGRPVRDMPYHLVFAAYRLAVVLVRLGTLFAATQAMPPEMTDELITNNPGIQYLAQLLEIPYSGQISMLWPGLDL